MASKAALKIKKKRWVPIFGPKMFGDQILGETYIGEMGEAQGRFVTVSMLQISHDPKKQNMSATFKINGQKEGGLAADFYGMKLAPSSLKRMVRRNKEKLDDSFHVVTNDGKLVQVKPLIVTRGHTTSAVLRDIRARMRNMIAYEASRSSYEKIAGDIVDHKLQRYVQEGCSALYPVGVSEIRQFLLIGDAKAKTGPGILPAPQNQPYVPKPKKKDEQKEEGESAEETPTPEAAPAEEKTEAPAEDKPKKKAKKKDEE